MKKVFLLIILASISSNYSFAGEGGEVKEEAVSASDLARRIKRLEELQPISRIQLTNGRVTADNIRTIEAQSTSQTLTHNRELFPLKLDESKISLERLRQLQEHESEMFPLRLEQEKLRTNSLKNPPPSFSASLQAGFFGAAEQSSQIVSQTLLMEVTKDGYSLGKKYLFQSKEDRLLEQQAQEALKSKTRAAIIQQLEEDKRLLIAFKQGYEQSHPKEDYPELHRQLSAKIINAQVNQLKLLGLDPEEVFKKEEHDTVNKLTSDENLTDLAEELEGDDESIEYTDVDPSLDVAQAA